MPGFDCRTCGQHHDTLPMCLGPDAPELWHQLTAWQRADGVLGSDQCVIDGCRFFVREPITLPVIDSPTPFSWLVWVSLSESNFLRSSERWEQPGRESEPPYFGWLQSELPGYPVCTLSLKTHVHTMPVGERPQIELESTDHPLAIEQRQGITLARVQ